MRSEAVQHTMSWGVHRNLSLITLTVTMPKCKQVLRLKWWTWTDVACSLTANRLEYPHTQNRSTMVVSHAPSALTNCKFQSQNQRLMVPRGSNNYKVHESRRWPISNTRHCSHTKLRRGSEFKLTNNWDLKIDKRIKVIQLCSASLRATTCCEETYDGRNGV